MNYGELIELIRLDRLGINVKRVDNLRRITPESDTITNGAIFLEYRDGLFSAVKFSGRKWEGYVKNSDYIRKNFELSSKLICDNFLEYGIDPASVTDIEPGLLNMITVAIERGLGFVSSCTDTDAKRLIGFAPSSRTKINTGFCFTKP